MDFRWHRTTHSPNWYIIPIGQRESFALSSVGVAVACPSATAVVRSDISSDISVSISSVPGVSDVRVQVQPESAEQDDDEDEL